MEVELHFIKTKNNIPQTVNFNNFHGMGNCGRDKATSLLYIINFGKYF